MSRRTQAGMVTAEMAVLLPTLVLVAATLAWLVGLGVAQVLCVDAARDAARALARAESRAVATELAQQSAPDGARVRFGGNAQYVEVTVTYRASPPGAVLDGLASFDLRASATTPLEVADVGTG